MRRSPCFAYTGHGRCVGDDELAPRGREEAIGDVDRDALLALGGQPIQEQRKIDSVPRRAVLARVMLEGG